MVGGVVYVLIDGSDRREDERLSIYTTQVPAIIEAQRIASNARHLRGRSFEEGILSHEAMADGWVFRLFCESHDDGESIVVRKVKVVM